MALAGVTSSPDAQGDTDDVECCFSTALNLANRNMITPIAGQVATRQIQVETGNGLKNAIVSVDKGHNLTGFCIYITQAEGLLYCVTPDANAYCML